VENYVENVDYSMYKVKTGYDYVNLLAKIEIIYNKKYF